MRNSWLHATTVDNSLGSPLPHQPSPPQSQCLTYRVVVRIPDMHVEHFQCCGREFSVSYHQIEDPCIVFLIKVLLRVMELTVLLYIMLPLLHNQKLHLGSYKVRCLFSFFFPPRRSPKTRTQEFHHRWKVLVFCTHYIFSMCP